LDRAAAAEVEAAIAAVTAGRAGQGGLTINKKVGGTEYQGDENPQGESGKDDPPGQSPAVQWQLGPHHFQLH